MQLQNRARVSCMGTSQEIRTDIGKLSNTRVRSYVHPYLCSQDPSERRYDDTRWQKTSLSTPDKLFRAPHGAQIPESCRPGLPCSSIGQGHASALQLVRTPFERIFLNLLVSVQVYFPANNECVQVGCLTPRLT